MLAECEVMLPRNASKTRAGNTLNITNLAADDVDGISTQKGYHQSNKQHTRNGKGWLSNFSHVLVALHNLLHDALSEPRTNKHVKEVHLMKRAQMRSSSTKQPMGYSMHMNQAQYYRLELDFSGLMRVSHHALALLCASKPANQTQEFCENFKSLFLFSFARYPSLPIPWRTLL
jgi:hypothetical protein